MLFLEILELNIQVHCLHFLLQQFSQILCYFIWRTAFLPLPKSMFLTSIYIGQVLQKHRTNLGDLSLSLSLYVYMNTERGWRQRKAGNSGRSDAAVLQSWDRISSLGNLRFCPSEFSADRMRPTHITGCKLLYLKSPDVNHIFKISSQQCLD